MTKNKQDELVRAYAMLTSLQKNIGESTDYSIPETLKHEFHTALDRLEGIGIDASEFRIPDSAAKRQPGASMYVKGKEIFSSEGDICVERRLILTKLGAIIGYLESFTSEKPRKIGFPTSENR